MDEARAIAAGWLAAGRPAWMVELSEVRGSAPRTAGTRMAVAADAVAGTIGGGHLELDAIAQARAALSAAAAAAHAVPAAAAAAAAAADAAAAGATATVAPGAPAAFERRYALGPSLGQCCGGAVVLRFEPLGPQAIERWPLQPVRFHLQLHGAGHVGRALVRLLETLPCRVDWIDERENEFALHRAARAGRPAAPNVRIVCVDSVAAEVAAAPAGAFCLVMTHDHDLDFAVCAAALARADLGFVGLIGSATKRARFERRLRARGLPEAAIARLACPIGAEGIDGKEPEVIALAVAAQLLREASRRAAAQAAADRAPAPAARPV